MNSVFDGNQSKRMEETNTFGFIEGDTTCTISPYFKIHEGKEEEWKDNAKKFYERTKRENDVIHFGFSYTDDGEVFLVGFLAGVAPRRAKLRHVGRAVFS